MNISNYDNFLLSILNHEDNIDYSQYEEELKYNLYITLLYLNNFNYHNEIEEEKNNKVSNFLRRLNNLKVKIQLKRKEEEINNLSKEVLSLYENNSKLINKYNIENDNIIDIINNLDSKELTTLIDKLTKEKMHKDYKKEEDNNLRENINNNILNNKENKINIYDFIILYDYLLDIDNYDQLLLNSHTNRLRIILIDNIINIIDNKDYKNISNNIIPLVLTYLINKDINYNNLNTSNFNIDNIKIQDLYSNTEKNNIENNAKWRNIALNNDYLFNEIIKIVKKGTYYFEEDKFILEDIEDNLSNFKTSITIDNMKKLLIDIMNTIN